MKTSLKLILIFYILQILSSLAVVPFGMIYSYLTQGTVSQAVSVQATLAPSMVLYSLLTILYLWRKGYLREDSALFFIPSTSTLLCCFGLGASAIVLVEFLMSFLDFLPADMQHVMNVLQSGWVGILGVTVLGPIAEECLFRGAITKTLLRSYSPTVAILLSGLLFGVIHINPAQIVSASLLGVLFAWLYYRTRSLIPTILLHVLNNSLSVYFMLNHLEKEHLHQFLGWRFYGVVLAVALLLFAFSFCRLWKKEIK